MKKHLKYIDGDSDKFWQIEATANQFIVTYGKNGSAGTSQTKSFDTEEACLKAAEKLLNEKIKKGYSENGAVITTDKVDAKTGKISNIQSVLEEYDAIVKHKNISQLLPFLEKNTKGNLEHIRKQIKKNKSYWMSFIDLSLEPGYKKLKDNQWNYGTRGDEKIKEIIALSAIATFDKTNIMSFEEALPILEKAQQPHILEILEWSKPNWIETFILDRFRKQDWMNFEYKSLRFLESKGFVSFNPGLFALTLSRFNSWRGDAKPREFATYLSLDETAYKRDVPLLYEYETNIQNSNFRESENANYNECNTWSIAFKLLLAENKLDRKVFIENAILIQTKEWNNNLKGFFRKLLNEIEPTASEYIDNQNHIFSYYNYSNPVIVNYAAELIKKIADHPSFNAKSYLEWVEPLMMRNDCKTAVKNTLMVFEKLGKANPKLNKTIALLIADVYIISDMNLQERATKLLLRIGSEKDTALVEKLSSYTAYMQGTVKPNLHKFLNEEALSLELEALEMYQFVPKKVAVLVDEVEIPQDWNDIIFLIGRFISSDEIIDAETVINTIITQRKLFPADYNLQLQPYLKQLENTYFDSALKNYTKNLLINKIADINVYFKISDKEYITLNTLKLIKPIIQKALQKNKEGSVLPLLSFPTHKPYWVAPKTLLERMIQYQTNNEEIDRVDLSIAICRMPREELESAIPLLEKLEGEMKDLMAYCLGVSSELQISSTSLISKLFQKVSGTAANAEKVALWSVASRTFYPNESFPEFEKTLLKDIPFVAAPFVPKITMKEKWNEWKNFTTKEIERSSSWTELRFDLPLEKQVPQNLIYNLDLHPKKERYTWQSEYVLQNESNTYYWNSLMPQNNSPLACLLLAKNCKTSEGAQNELKGFLNIINQSWFEFADTSLLVFACCFFQEKKEVRLLASEVLINLVENSAIDIMVFSTKLAYLISNKYGVFMRLIDSIVNLKDISPAHNSALFLLLDGIFQNINFKDKLPTNFKKLLENYVDVVAKTTHTPSKQALHFLEKYKENNALKPLIKQIINL